LYNTAIQHNFAGKIIFNDDDDDDDNNFKKRRHHVISHMDWAISSFTKRTGELIRLLHASL